MNSFVAGTVRDTFRCNHVDLVMKKNVLEVGTFPFNETKQKMSDGLSACAVNGSQGIKPSPIPSTVDESEPCSPITLGQQGRDNAQARFGPDDSQTCAEVPKSDTQQAAGTAVKWPNATAASVDTDSARQTEEQQLLEEVARLRAKVADRSQECQASDISNLLMWAAQSAVRDAVVQRTNEHQTLILEAAIAHDYSRMCENRLRMFEYKRMLELEQAKKKVTP